MRKSNFFVATVLVFASVVAHAEYYRCHADSNPSRGFEVAFDIQISGAKVGGDITLQGGSGKTNKLGTVTEVTSIKADDFASKPAFDAVLGYIADQDVSGVSENILQKISSIQIYKDGKSEIEVSVFRLFLKEKQVGGSILIDGHGTSCL